ncbi:hypothetical protein [Rhizobium sp. Root483D2]|uniref:hypothetical protein n=1 Tax=Rhizobium sp. Root483D2 TaxID=1736545 RepID=UPI000713E3A3|nr:hypothetical protein [Rhizobium sp. Root483D2]KQY31783.1 hypothetical protein ASD32_04095 [Rhizobium sp. Root483D2]
MKQLTIDATVNISDIPDDVILAQARDRKDVRDQLYGDFEDQQDELSASDFSTEELVEALQERDIDLHPWLSRVYRLLAEGKANEAMDMIYENVDHGIAPPSHERAIADLLSGTRSYSHV